MTTMMEAYEIRAEARRLLNNNWATAVGTVFLMEIILAGAGSMSQIFLFLAWIPMLLVGGAVELGLAAFFINLAEKDRLIFEEAFYGFKNIVKAMGVYFFSGLFVFLWSLLLIVPGIIAAIRYAQAFFILKEDPEVPVMEAIKKSSEMMRGYKTDYFLLQLSFIGWGFLCLFTFGIGFLWLSPYVKTSNAVFYRELKKIREEEKAGTTA
ncbi:DUF975 family protein [Candidatus Mcinerneyibacteriota bacterium]|nr:DUF975 family protein [Candidatus Mcinerneyibacteriota bacterium]